MKFIRNILICFIFFYCVDLSAQRLQSLLENPVLKEYRFRNPVRLKSTSGTPLTLPFFEDFSALTILPDPAKWSDEYAFINSSFGNDPISIGVATLDAIDENGDVYALTDSPTISDMLTSQSFDLSSFTAPDDTIRFSFFYQAGGKGEAPELNDSLILEYFSPSENKWSEIWFAVADAPTKFQQVILEVPGTYYQNGFRFRFKNYTTLSVANVADGEGALSNADCWNIDYLMMNTDPVYAHQSPHDITIVEPPRELMDFYEIVPWSHLNDAQSITRNIMRYVIRNLDKEDTVNVGRSYYVQYLNSGKTDFYEEYYSSVGPDTLDRRNDPFFAPFVRTDDSKEGNIKVCSYLITSAEQNKQNDTASIILNFTDNYAYDDGTPEFGFGIPAPSTEGALLALRFRVYKPDTLRALDMMFNKTRNDFNADLRFRLCVWSDEGGLPGQLIYYSPEEFTPGVTSGMPGFRRFPINPDIDLVVTDTIIYVGWQQVSDAFLNLGYDVNRNNLNRTYVSTSGTWYHPNPGNIPGTVMIRAVFGSKDVITGISETPANPDDIILYPNPASETITIKATDTRIERITIYDALGRIMMETDGEHDSLDVSALSPGLYQVILNTDRGYCTSQKIIISH